jgi:hypothetical protein
VAAVRFTPDATGEVVAIDGTGAEFRAVVPGLGPAVRAVVADRIARVGDDEPVALVVYADAAADIGEAWAAARDAVDT